MLRTAFFTTLAIVSTAAVAGPATPSDDFGAQVAGRPLAQGERYVCFSRDYDAAHLRRHPDQNVKRATLLMHVGPTKYHPDAVSVDFHFGFRTISPNKSQVVGLACELKTDDEGRSHVACIDSGCGYSHTVALVQTADPGRPRLVVTLPPLEDNNYHDDGPGADPIALHSDDRVFEYRPAPLAECRPLIAEARKY